MVRSEERLPLCDSCLSLSAEVCGKEASCRIRLQNGAGILGREGSGEGGGWEMEKDQGIVGLKGREARERRASW